jgi:hypothetical protein
MPGHFRRLRNDHGHRALINQTRYQDAQIGTGLAIQAKAHDYRVRIAVIVAVAQ